MGSGKIDAPWMVFMKSLKKLNKQLMGVINLAIGKSDDTI